MRDLKMSKFSLFYCQDLLKVKIDFGGVHAGSCWKKRGIT